MTLKEKVLENDYVMYKLSQILLYNHTQQALTNNINTGECQILLCTFIIPCEKERERERKKIQKDQITIYINLNQPT